jgi:hypothetical protein
MKRNGLKIYLLTIAVLISININAQRFTTALNTLNTTYRQERLYLQFDRSVYKAGETIWFKAYLFAGNFPSLISKTLYTELSDANGKLLQRITSPVIMSSAAGSFNIPATITGTMIVRCYTKWMLNFDSSFLFTKAITVTEPQKAAGKTTLLSTSNTNPVTVPSSCIVQFFPEGGDLVQAVESRIAFKATDHFGIPVSIAGDVIDSKGKFITSFSSVHDGMGTFELRPETTELYKAVWKDQLGQKYETLLPAAKPSGVVLEVNNTGQQVEFKLKRPSATPAYPYVYIVAQMQQQQLYRAKINTSQKEIFNGAIPTDKFPSGIIQFTVFSPDEQPLAERIVFINLHDYSFTAGIETLIKDTGRRKKNIIQIDIPDTISCNLSVSVTDADLDYNQAADNIYSTILLTSDIKGYVYNPAYYFSGNADSVADHLDLVMMTNGWRRFKWNEVLADHFPELKYLPENYISINGQVSDVKRSQVAGREVNGILEMKNRNKEYLISTLDKDGKFSFSGMIFYDTAKLYYQFNNDKNKALTSRVSFNIKSNLLKDPLHIPMGNILFPVFNKTDTSSLAKSNQIYRYQAKEMDIFKTTTLKTVVVKGKEKTKYQLMDEAYTTGFFSDDPAGQSRIILPEDDIAFLAAPDLFSYLKGRVAGLEITVADNQASITWRGFPTSLFVDEVSQTSMSFETGKLMEDPSYILSLPMSEIAMVKIFEPPFFGSGSASSGGQGGAISVYLKKGRTGHEMVKGLEFTPIAGYTAFKEFYTPDYSIPNSMNLPDHRTTLYWNPFIFTDKNNHHILLTFYNNDFTENMKLVIEGCNENGKLIRIEKIL